jgi:outer membrane protein TolC
MALAWLACLGLAWAAGSPPEPGVEATGTSSSALISLDQYLGQVRSGNSGIQAARATIQALELSAQEAETVFSPLLNGEISHLDNRAQSPDPLFLGERTQDTAWNLGLSKRWFTGTLTSLSYRSDLSKVDYPAFSGLPGIPSALLALITPSSDPYYTSVPTLAISQPLLKDFMAAGPQATVEKVRTTAAAAQMMNRFKIQQTLFAAEQAYIQLALARTAVAIQEESLARNHKIQEWALRREAQNLADRVDTLQTEAAVRQVEINLAQAREDLQNVLRQFNTLRGQSEQLATESLAELGPPVPGLERKRDRLDVRAAEYDLQSRRAAETEVGERYLPDLSLYGTASLTGRDKNYAAAFSDSLTLDHPVTTVGLKLSANLDLPIIQHALEGARLARESGENDIRQKRLDLDKDWAILLQHWQSVTERLRVATELQTLQKEKADREKVRFRNGRTTNFQMLRFEDDYAQAELLRLRLLGEAHLLMAQARLYNAEAE